MSSPNPALVLPGMSGFERFTALMGGEDKLPPRLPSPLPKAEPHPDEEGTASAKRDDGSNSLPTVEEAIAMNKRYAEEARAPRAPPLQPQPSIHSNDTPCLHPVTPTAADNPSPAAHMHDPARRGITLSPFLAVTRFCYKFVRPELSQLLASAFFDAGKIYNRSWDIYYVWSSYAETQKPTTLVPSHQLQDLLDEINVAFPNAHIKITSELIEEGLVLDFDTYPDALHPRWLGRSTSREQYGGLVNMAQFHRSDGALTISDRSLEAYRNMIDRAVEAGKNKPKAKTRLNQQTAVEKRQMMGKQLARVQRYLGLRMTNENDLMPGMSDLTITPVDPSKPVPYQFDLDAIFIAIDAEAYEKHPKVVTEVGIATLDTRDLQANAPGKVGEHWHAHIRARHFRIIEYKQLRNTEYVQGCPDKFEFGQSEFVSMDDIASVLTSCFHPPFSKRTDDENQSSTTAQVQTGAVETRKIILVGHDVGQDIQYMQSIGFSVLNRSNLVEAIDTATLFRTYTRDSNPTGLGKVLYHFDLTGWHPHNAGNDAVHTLWAMLAICVKAATEQGDEEAEKRHEELKKKRKESAMAAAAERVAEEDEGWKMNPGEHGGAPLAPMEEDSLTKKEKEKRTFGPERPSASGGLYTINGAPLDV